MELEHFACSFVNTLLSSHIDYTSMAKPFKAFGHLTTYVHFSFFFQTSNVVYVKMPFHPPDPKRRWYKQSGHFYVGSTAITAVKREFNRVAKLKQIRRNLAVHAELSTRYWSNRSDFETYTCIVLQACTTYEDAWVREHLYISSWQPALNHPFILNFSNSNQKDGRCSYGNTDKVR